MGLNRGTLFRASVIGTGIESETHKIFPDTAKEIMALPKKILTAYIEFPPIAFELKEAFEKMGIEVHLFLSSDIPVSYFHRLFCKRFTRWGWSLRLLEKGQALFPNHPKRFQDSRHFRIEYALL